MASSEPGSKKFRTKNLNSLFLAESGSGSEPKEKSSPGPVPQRRTSLATARGTYRLNAMKDEAKESSWLDDRTPEPGHKSATQSPMPAPAQLATPPVPDHAAAQIAAASASPNASSTPSSGASAAATPAPALAPASAAASASPAPAGGASEPFSWDDEDDNWQPPTVSSAQVVSQVSGAQTASPAPPASGQVPWTTKKPAPAAAKPLHERIAELKQAKGPAHGHGGHGGGFSRPQTFNSNHHVPQTAPGVDGLSRFRIRGDPADLETRQPRYGRFNDDFRGHDDFRGGRFHDNARGGRFDRHRDPLDDTDWRRRPAPARPEPAAAAEEPGAPDAAERKKHQEAVMLEARLRLAARKESEEAERREREDRLRAKMEELDRKKQEEQAAKQRERAEKERKRMEDERRARAERLEREDAERERRPKRGDRSDRVRPDRVERTAAHREPAELNMSWRKVPTGPAAHAPAGPAAMLTPAASPVPPPAAPAGPPVAVNVPKLGKLRLNLGPLPYAGFGDAGTKEPRGERQAQRVAVPALEVLDYDELDAPEDPLGFSSTLFAAGAPDGPPMAREPLPHRGTKRGGVRHTRSGRGGRRRPR